MFLGLDLGTSAVKAVLVDAAGAVRASASRPLTVSHPKPLWSEQAPADWWLAAQSAIEQLLAVAGREGIRARSIAGIGLSGQMHGATVLDANAHVLRPAILWNDGRSAAECEKLQKNAALS